MLTLLCRDLKTVGPVRETRGRRLNCRPGPSSWDVQPHVPLQSIAGKHAEACHGAIEIANVARTARGDLRHTFGRRLRAAGVSLEDRQDLRNDKLHRALIAWTPGS